MSKHDFPAEEFADRLARTRRAIAEAGLDWLIAIHPVANAVFEEYPCVAWLLRAKAFLRFGYDPDSVFSAR